MLNLPRQKKQYEGGKDNRRRNVYAYTIWYQEKKPEDRELEER